MSLTDQELKVKVAQRGTVRANATKGIQTIEAALASSPPDIEKAKTMAKLLKAYQERLVVLDDAILPYQSDEKLSEEVERTQQYQDRIVVCIEECNEQISNQAGRSNGGRPHHAYSHENAPKLPKLEIAKFHGDPLLWEEFWDNFKACIHDRDDLPVIDKFKYLKSFLDSEALRMVDGYRLTVANYDEVVQALKERFGDPEMAVFAHFEALIGLRTASYDLAELRAVLDKCESHIRSLVALGMPESTFGVVFTPLILSKLPRWVKMELYRKNGSQKWTLGNLRTLLKEEIAAREKCERVFANSGESTGEKSAAKPKATSDRTSKKIVSTSSSLLTTPAKSDQQRPVPNCVFCTKKHYSSDCRTYPNLDSRRRQLQDRCFCCLKKGHGAKDCRSKRQCYHCKRESHHQSLCPKRFGNQTKEKEGSLVASTAESSKSSKPSAGQSGSPESSLSLQSPNSKAILQTAVAEIKGGGGKAKARLYFDTGGSRSFISTATAKKIGAKFIGEESVSVGRFRDSHHSTITYRIYEFDVCLPNGNKVTVRMSAERTISCPIQLVPIESSIMANVKLAEPPVKKASMVPIDVLIGNDYYYTFIGETQLRCPNGVVLLESPFGFVTGGTIRTKNMTDGHYSSMFLHAGPPPSAEIGVERFWCLEDIGIKDDPYTTDDELALKAFNDSVKYEDGRYSVKWPWKDGSPELNSNYALAHGRLKSLLKRVSSDTTTLNKYNDTIVDQRNKGIIEKAPAKPEGKEHYLPHHCVITPSKTTTKLRVVYDASAKMSKQDYSLNECLHRGPVFLSNLVGILIRWRIPKVAFVSDIEKAFLQVSLQACQRDVTRFLWLKDITQPVSSSNLEIYRFCRVPFGVISSPFLLAATLLYHLRRKGGTVAASIQRNIYVDNVFGGASDCQQALDYYREAKSLLSGAAMNLREWFSNSSTFLEQIAESDRGSGETTTVLGLKWNVTTDEFSVPFNVKLGNSWESWTKRRVLQTLASVFDPCGLISPVTIKAKMLMQTLWKQKQNWDDRLPDDQVERWKSLHEELNCISQISISRQFKLSIGAEGHLQLHCYCDASTSAYACAVFIRIQDQQTAKADLVFAKARVAPVKYITIPRLELLAVVIGVRSAQFVQQELDVPVADVFIWTDSQCVLSWIRKSSVSTTFVRNRLREIGSHPNFHFGYVPSADNPADLASRGVSYETMKDSQLWWQGPNWLVMASKCWPKQPSSPNSKVGELEPVLTTTSVLAPSYDPAQYLMDVRRSSSLGKLLRITSYCRRFVTASRSESKLSVISAVELAAAQTYWDKHVQDRCFQPLKDFSIPEAKNLQSQLGLFLDNSGLIRCQGRYGGSSMRSQNACPILLPKNHPYTSLVIMDAHNKVLHAGVKSTLAALRQRYWVIHGRSQVKLVLKECRVCRYYRGQPFRTPTAAPLPEFRMQEAKPFEVVGIDYMGPLVIRDRAANTESKVWVCLFTCATIRALHLELIPNLSTEQFLLAFRRFMATYGRPKLVISDNAKYFQAANRTITRMWKEILQSDAVQSVSTINGVSWKFITELAPWMGGFYERMVGMVKSALKKTIHNQCLAYIELQTLLCEVASVINNRPLLYLENSVEKDYLSPAHFLMKEAESFPTVEPDDEYSPKRVLADDLILKWRRIQNKLESFWQMWRSSYLQGLQEYTWKPKNRNSSAAAPAVGNVVIIKDSALRGTWKLGLITDLIASHDGVVRAAVVKTSSGGQLRRALKLLTPLEMSNESTGVDWSSSNNPTGRHTKRRVAMEARKKIQRQLHDARADDSD